MKPTGFMRLGVWTLILALLAPTFSQAANVDLATEPMVSGLTKIVRPNIFFILDDSGSMGDEGMPDQATTDLASGKFCARNYGYNTIYYNPNTIYVAPKNADGTSFADSIFSAAKDDGFSILSTVSNLGSTTSVTNNVTVTTTANLPNNPFTTQTTAPNTRVTVNQTNHGFITGQKVTFAGLTGSGSPKAIGGIPISTLNGGGPFTITVINTNSYYFTAPSAATSNSTGGGGSATVTYTTVTPVTTTTPNFYYYSYTASPNSPPSTCQTDASYTQVTAASLTAAQQTNFANWYSYYRKRILMMKSSAGRAFASIGDSYRVGFTTISETGTGASKFLAIAKFDATQKAAWYQKFYAQQPGSYTPLRGALSKAGRYYAGKLVTGNADPVQYSCQQNYTIMTTDGYWNTKSETATYNALREDNLTAVGDQDGVSGTARPYFDSLAKPNSLADIAMYYYKTDLRPTTGLGGLIDDGVTRVDVSTNNVPTNTTDSANWQHMVTFTIGLGVSGVLNYNANYLTGGSSDYTAILQGTKNWPDPLTSPLSTSDTVTSRIDDLWHAAVNGHGKYLSAGDPTSVVSALTNTLSAISQKTASSASAATSNLEPVSGDNFAYVAQYTTALWTGDLLARTIDLVTGNISSTSVWSAKTQLQATVSASSDTRTIYAFSAAATGKLKAFTSANLTTEKAAGYFRSSGSNPGGALSQYSLWSPTQQAAATDDTMIAFLRGQTGSQDNAANTNRLYRDRTAALGDIVNAAPVFVKKPPFNYADAGYSAFKTAQAGRLGTVYVGANDGMLHALDAATGNERWAYIPTEVIPNLYKLADTGYPTNHRFYVDGGIVVGDVFDGTNWRTVLVGGLGGGGRSFYALDVTDPTAPKALWEYGAQSGTVTDTDMGYSYGNPVITKRASDGKWVVAFTSGYNNTLGDSKGRLYVVDAVTGAKLSEIITDNTVNDPNVSGIGKISNFVLDTLVDNSTQYVYGGDLGGTLWRFDINAASSQNLGQTTGTTGNEPITVRPELARVKDSVGNYYRVVYFGTGRYLGFNDLSTTAPSNTIAQTVFAVKDTGTNLGNLKANAAGLIAQSLDISGSPRTIPSPQAVDWSVANGWYVDLPVGERVNIDPRLQLGTLVLVSNAPKDDYCVVGGSSYLYALDYTTGGAITGQAGKYVGWPVGNSIATGLTVVRLPTGKLAAIVNEADTTIRTIQPPTSASGGTGVRRVGWREIY
jgi:type IV pilus assembly protein PilY1